MTNLSSIAGGTIWALVAMLLLGAALEPVAPDGGARIEIAEASSNSIDA